ncbi:MAG TPA: recombinase family protein [Ktedonobacteraceae bacterium]
MQRRLNQAQEQTRTGKTVWDRATIWGILKNPAYQGEAACAQNAHRAAAASIAGPTWTRHATQASAFYAGCSA